MCNAGAWTQQSWKSCANGSNIVALRFSDHGTKEMLEVVGSKVVACCWELLRSVKPVKLCTKGANNVGSFCVRLHVA